MWCLQYTSAATAATTMPVDDRGFVVGRSKGRLRFVGRLRSELLRQYDHSSDVLRHLRPHGSVRPRQCRRRSPYETPRGERRRVDQRV